MGIDNIRIIFLVCSIVTILSISIVNTIVEFCRKRSKYSSGIFTTPGLILCFRYIFNIIVILYYIYISVYPLEIDIFEDDESNKILLESIYEFAIMVNSISFMVSLLSLVFKSIRYVSSNICYSCHFILLLLICVFLKEPISIFPAGVAICNALVTPPDTYKSKLN